MTASNALAEVFSQPALGTKVKPRTDDEKWFRVPGEIRNLHAVGRTVMGLIPLVTSYQVEQLARIWPPKLMRENMRGWDSLARSQKLDMIATEILRQDREQVLGNSRVLKHRRDYLSPGQWMDRQKHEIPMSEEQMLAILNEERCHLYRGSPRETNIESMRSKIKRESA